MKLMKNTNREERTLKEITNVPLNQFADLEIDEQVLLINECVASVNNECLRKKSDNKKPKVVW